jgi:hypothetical protein
MKAKARLLGPAIAALLAAGIACWYFFIRIPPVTAEYLQGEWVQDPDFLQHAGENLDAQRAEVDQWENYEFAFQGSRLTAWRNVFDDGKKDMAGWAKGRGTSFSSEFTLAPAKNATVLRYTDHTPAPAEAMLARDKEKIAVSIGDRKFRLIKAPADNLRARNLLPAQK